MPRSDPRPAIQGADPNGIGGIQVRTGPVSSQDGQGGRAEG
jgi:hypothetical protein